MLAIARSIAEAGDTYAFDPDISDPALLSYWQPEAPWQAFAACEGGQLLGMFRLGPNQPGPGSHIANASFAVSAAARGKGLGRWMAEQSLDKAREAGFSAMQFNYVVASNEPAVALWRSLGFETIGTTPSGFQLPSGDFVDVLIMHRSLV